jgi:hypothetical protein
MLSCSPEPTRPVQTPPPQDDAFDDDALRWFYGGTAPPDVPDDATAHG